MKYRIESDRLVMTCTPEEQERLRKLRDQDPDKFDSDEVTTDLLQKIVTDDCFFWIDPSLTRDLTDAPMLAILGDDEEGPADFDPEKEGFPSPPGMYLVGSGGEGEGDLYMPVLYRWAFMNYQVSSPQRDLMLTGEAIWEGGVFIDRGEQNALSCTEGDIGMVPDFGG